MDQFDEPIDSVGNTGKPFGGPTSQFYNLALASELDRTGSALWPETQCAFSNSCCTVGHREREIGGECASNHLESRCPHSRNDNGIHPFSSFLVQCEHPRDASEFDLTLLRQPNPQTGHLRLRPGHRGDRERFDVRDWNF